MGAWYGWKYQPRRSYAMSLAVAETKFASLKQYPPERTFAGECSECGIPARWVMMTVPAGAVKVCAKHLGSIWNEQGRPVGV